LAFDSAASSMDDENGGADLEATPREKWQQYS